jgi:hypothetical protein
MEHMPMGGITEESPPLCTTGQVFGHRGDVAPRGDPTAHIKTPVGIQVIDDPVIALHGGELGDHRAEMPRKILAGACWATVPEDLARRHDKGGE